MNSAMLEESVGADPTTSAPVVGLALDASAPIRSLAVLPFENFSEDGEPDYFSAGMHEAVVSQLSRLTALRVVSRTSVMQYAGATKSIPQISQELGVEGVVEGSVLRAGDRVRITVQLIHGPSDTHVWSNNYERDFADVIALQSEVAQAIAGEIQAELTPEEETRLASVTPINPEAHEEYLRRRFEQSKGTPEGFRQAVGYYEEAVERDSSYADAYTGLAGSQLLLQMSESDSMDVHPAVAEAVHRALELDEHSDEARAILSELDRYVVVVADSLSESVRITVPDLDSLSIPSEDWVLSFTDFGQQVQRLTLEREAEAQGAQRLERQAGAARRMVAMGDYERAEQILRQVLERDPSLAEAWDALEHLAVVRGDFEGVAQLRRERAEGKRADADDLSSIALLEQAVTERGAEGYWGWRLQELDERAEGGEQVSQVDYAAAYVGLDRREEALQSLEQAYELRDRKVFSLARDPTWDPLRGEPRFRELLTKVRRVPAPREGVRER
jgi:TolB-like protein/Tfp pilus assembly protein PilF